jgi:hypothetical protein
MAKETEKLQGETAMQDSIASVVTRHENGGKTEDTRKPEKYEIDWRSSRNREDVWGGQERNHGVTLCLGVRSRNK